MCHERSRIEAHGWFSQTFRPTAASAAHFHRASVSRSADAAVRVDSKLGAGRQRGQRCRLRPTPNRRSRAFRCVGFGSVSLDVPTRMRVGRQSQVEPECARHRVRRSGCVRPVPPERLRARQRRGVGRRACALLRRHDPHRRARMAQATPGSTPDERAPNSFPAHDRQPTARAPR